MGGRGSGRKPDTERDREIARLYAGGLSLKEVGRRFGLSPEGVQSALRRLGVPRCPPGPCTLAALPAEERRRIAVKAGQASAARRAAERRGGRDDGG
jgi:DNA-binding NarL/FixJ family response regulator